MRTNSRSPVPQQQTRSWIDCETQRRGSNKRFSCRTSEQSASSISIRTRTGRTLILVTTSLQLASCCERHERRRCLRTWESLALSLSCSYVRTSAFEDDIKCLQKQTIRQIGMIAERDEKRLINNATHKSLSNLTDWHESVPDHEILYLNIPIGTFRVLFTDI